MIQLKATFACILSLILIMQPMQLTAAPAAGQAAATNHAKVTAASLLKGAERGLTRTIKAARASKEPALAPDQASGKPFWQALKKLNAAL